MKKQKCCGQISFDLVELETKDRGERAHVVICVHCGSVLHLQHSFCAHLRLHKLAHKLGFDLKH